MEPLDDSSDQSDIESLKDRVLKLEKTQALLIDILFKKEFTLYLSKVRREYLLSLFND